VPDEVGRGAARGGPGEIVGAGHRPGARGLEASLASGGVRFDVWKSEAPLHDEGWVARASSGSGRPAMSTSRTGRRVPLHQLGDDKDRLIYRSDGRPTYFAATRLRDGEVLPGASTPDLHWGVDHTGRSRNRNAAQAMGYDRSLPGLLVAGSGSWPTASRSRCRSVRDVRDPRRNARCRGTDAARVLRLRAAHVAFDFDIELARKQSSDNPSTTSSTPCPDRVDPAQGPRRRLAPRPTERAAGREPRRAGARGGPAARGVRTRCCRGDPGITAYGDGPRHAVHAFYRDARVIDAAEPERSAKRLALALATKTTLANALALLGISAPEAM